MLDKAKAFDDIIGAVGDKELGLEGFKEDINSWGRIDVRIVIAVPSFYVFVEENSGHAGLFFSRDLSKIKIFFYTIGTDGDIAKGCIGAIKHSRFGDFESGHRGVDFKLGLVGLVRL